MRSHEIWCYVLSIADLQNILREQREIIKEHSKVVAELGKGKFCALKWCMSMHECEL